MADAASPCVPRRRVKGTARSWCTRSPTRARELGARELLLASAIPRYVWPGVDLANTRAGMLLESCGFAREWLGDQHGDRHGVPARAARRRARRTRARSRRARLRDRGVPALGCRSSTGRVALGTAFAARDADGATIGFGCHSVNRFGWIGPMATDPARQHGGVGSAVRRRVLRRPGAARLRDRRDLVGEQPALLREVRRPGLASVHGGAAVAGVTGRWLPRAVSIA